MYSKQSQINYRIVESRIIKKLQDKGALEKNIVLIQAGPHCCVYDEDAGKFIRYVSAQEGQWLTKNGIRWTTKLVLKNKSNVIAKIMAMRNKTSKNNNARI